MKKEPEFRITTGARSEWLARLWGELRYPGNYCIYHLDQQSANKHWFGFYVWKLGDPKPPHKKPWPSITRTEMLALGMLFGIVIGYIALRVMG